MQDNIKKEIGIKINTLLALQNKKQKDLAKEIGVSDNTISYFAKGERAPNLEQIIKMSKIFNVSADYLLGLEKEPTNDKDLQFVCKYLGISSKSVESIKNAVSYNEICNEDKTIVDDFLSLEDAVWRLLRLISEYRKICVQPQEFSVENFDAYDKVDLITFRIQQSILDISKKIAEK